MTAPATDRRCGTCDYWDEIAGMPDVGRCSWGERNLPASMASWQTTRTMRREDGTLCPQWMARVMGNLRTGKDVPRPVALAVMMAMESLPDQSPMAPWLAVEIARDPAFRPSAEILAILDGAGLTIQGRMNAATRDVILAMVQDDGVSFGSPWAGGGE